MEGDKCRGPVLCLKAWRITEGLCSASLPQPISWLGPLLVCQAFVPRAVF